MKFHVLSLSIELVSDVRDAVRVIRQKDRDLANQLCRAVNSIALNLSEARRREGRDRLHHFRIAAGSADESRTALRLAEAWGYISNSSLEAALVRLENIIPILWKLTH